MDRAPIELIHDKSNSSLKKKAYSGRKPSIAARQFHSSCSEHTHFTAPVGSDLSGRKRELSEIGARADGDRSPVMHGRKPSTAARQFNRSHSERRHFPPHVGTDLSGRKSEPAVIGVRVDAGAPGVRKPEYGEPSEIGARSPVHGRKPSTAARQFNRSHSERRHFPPHVGTDLSGRKSEPAVIGVRADAGAPGVRKPEYVLPCMVNLGPPSSDEEDGFHLKPESPPRAHYPRLYVEQETLPKGEKRARVDSRTTSKVKLCDNLFEKRRL